MQNMARLRQDTLPRWHELLSALAQREHLLVEGVMRRVEGGTRHYGTLVTPEDFRNSSADAFRYLLGLLTDGAPPGPLVDLPHRIGVHRAAQGIPLENLITTVREDFAVLWSTLLWTARASDMPVLIAHVEDLWRAVDDFATEIQTSYLREHTARTELDLSRQRAMLTALFGSAELSRSLLRQIAVTLRLPEEGTFQVIAADPGDRPTLDAFVAQVPGQEGHVLTAEVDDAVVAFWDTSAPGAPTAELCGDLRCVWSPPARLLTEVPARARTALGVLRVLPADRRGPATMADTWDLLAADHLTRVSPEFTAGLLHHLDACPSRERDGIVETARAFLRSGSVAGTAEALFCHRNTVLNRLRRFRELTTLDLTVPREAALAVVLLSRSAEPPSPRHPSDDRAGD